MTGNRRHLEPWGDLIDEAHTIPRFSPTIWLKNRRSSTSREIQESTPKYQLNLPPLRCSKDQFMILISAEIQRFCQALMVPDHISITTSSRALKTLTRQRILQLRYATKVNSIILRTWSRCTRVISNKRRMNLEVMIKSRWRQFALFIWL